MSAELEKYKQALAMLEAQQEALLMDLDTTRAQIRAFRFKIGVTHAPHLHVPGNDNHDGERRQD